MVKLFGLTVKELQTNASFGGTGKSEMRIVLIEDPADGDSASWPAGGSPVSLTYGSLSFTGLFQQFLQSKDVHGYPTYSAVVTDPSEVLASSTLITEFYKGPSLITNIINIYGYYENLIGFGGAEANDIGMTWAKLYVALLDIVNNTAGTYGGPLNYKGYAYGLDLSEMPSIPADYRISAHGGTVLDLISNACRDVGFDPFFIIDGSNIKVKTIDRSAAIDPDALVNWIASGPLTGIVSRSSIGLEVRNEPTSALLVGGQQSSMVVSASFASYWGDDVSGNPIIGVDYVHDDLPDEPAQIFTLPAIEVADALGDTVYETNTIEMRCVLSGESQWHQYLAKYKPAVETLFKDVFGKMPINGVIKIDALNAKRADLLAALNDQIRIKSHLMYHYLLKYAQEYYGKKFLVQIPTVAQYGPTSAIPNKIYSHEVDQSGYINGGGSAIGLAPLDSVKFETGDGRIVSFATIPTADTIDAGGLDPQNMSIVSNVIYTRTSVAPRIIQSSGISCVVVTFADPFLERKALLGGPVGLAINSGGSGEAVKVGAFGNRPLTTYPNYVTPTNFGIPIRSNTEVYGPWYAQGAPGKVRFEQDSTLVPWAFNSISILNDVGNARVSALASSQPSNNSGDIVLAGIPLFSLGDVPQAGGPPIASIDMQYSVSGFTTTYRFATFTLPNRGAYAREYQQNEQRTHLLTLDTRRKVIRQAAKNILIGEGIKEAKEARQFRKNLPPWIMRESPHEAFVAQVYQDGDDLRVGVSTATQEEALGLSNADDDEFYKNTCIVAQHTLFAPFETVNDESQDSGLMPKSYIRTDYGSSGYRDGNNGIFAYDYCPFVPPHTIEGLTWGDAYTNYNSRQNRIDAISPLQSVTGVRSVGLRGPLYLTGYGNQVPYDGAPSAFDGNRMSVSDWKSGPVDHIWDDWRGVWSSHDLMTMILPDGGVAAGSYADCLVGDSSKTIRVYNNSSKAIPTGGNIVAGYAVNEDKWYVITKDEDFTLGNTDSPAIGGLDDHKSNYLKSVTGLGLAIRAGETTDDFSTIEGLEASITQFGMVSITGQSFAGDKEFIDLIKAGTNLVNGPRYEDHQIFDAVAESIAIGAWSTGGRYVKMFAGYTGAPTDSPGELSVVGTINASDHYICNTRDGLSETLPTGYTPVFEGGIYVGKEAIPTGSYPTGSNNITLGNTTTYAGGSDADHLSNKLKSVTTTGLFIRSGLTIDDYSSIEGLEAGVTQWGMMTTNNQSFAGDKEFVDLLKVGTNLWLGPRFDEEHEIHDALGKSVAIGAWSTGGRYVDMFTGYTGAGDSPGTLRVLGTINSSDHYICNEKDGETFTATPGYLTKFEGGIAWAEDSYTPPNGDYDEGFSAGSGDDGNWVTGTGTTGALSDAGKYHFTSSALVHHLYDAASAAPGYIYTECRYYNITTSSAIGPTFPLCQSRFDIAGSTTYWHDGVGWGVVLDIAAGDEIVVQFKTTAFTSAVLSLAGASGRTTFHRLY